MKTNDKRLEYLLELRSLELEMWHSFLHTRGQDRWEYGTAYESLANTRTDLQEELGVCCV